MVRILITDNDADQRLDRFLRKYLAEAPLGGIYRMIRKDVKLNGRRASRETRLAAGDELVLYISDEALASYTKKKEPTPAARRAFCIVREDGQVLAVSKPAGLLIHGDGREKKDTLVNQVTDYLIEKGEYVPRAEKSFAPAAANRLDRNTSGLVLFGKNAAALRALAEMFREKTGLRKLYLTVVHGTLEETLHLRGQWSKDADANKVRVALAGAGTAAVEAAGGRAGGAREKDVETIVRPLAAAGGRTLAEVELVTGRTHQIRAHLAAAGYPIAGDPKYGDAVKNRRDREQYGLQSQFLHAYKIDIGQALEPLSAWTDTRLLAPLPKTLRKMADAVFGPEWSKACGLE